MKKYIITIGCALVAQITHAHTSEPFDYRRAARDIQFQTGCTYDDARFEAKSWARRNGYDY